MALSQFKGATIPQDVEKKVKERGSAILKFSLEDCPPCRRLASALDQYVTPYSVNVIEIQRTPDDGFDGMAEEYNVRSYPTLVIVDSSMRKLDGISGFSSKKTLDDFIEKNRDFFAEARNDK
jgi:thiol-disulfide isomerase/thioredoxin